MRSALVVGSFALALGAVPPAADAQPLRIMPQIHIAIPAITTASSRDPRVVVIARIQLGGQGRRGDGWWRSNGYRPVTVYYVDGRYYDRWDNRFRGRYVRQEVVYQRGGRLYRDWDDRDDYGHGYGQRADRRDDRYDRRDDRRDDRYGQRNDRRDDRRDARSDKRHGRRDDRGNQSNGRQGGRNHR